MKSVGPRSSKSDQNTKAPTARSKRPASQKLPALPPSSSEDLHALIAKRAYELYADRHYRNGVALEDWLNAEREVLSALTPE